MSTGPGVYVSFPGAIPIMGYMRAQENLNLALKSDTPDPVKLTNTYLDRASECLAEVQKLYPENHVVLSQVATLQGGISAFRDQVLRSVGTTSQPDVVTTAPLGGTALSGTVTHEGEPKTTAHRSGEVTSERGGGVTSERTDKRGAGSSRPAPSSKDDDA